MCLSHFLSYTTKMENKMYPGHILSYTSNMENKMSQS